MKVKFTIKQVVFSALFIVSLSLMSCDEHGEEVNKRVPKPTSVSANSPSNARSNLSTKVIAGYDLIRPQLFNTTKLHIFSPLDNGLGHGWDEGNTIPQGSKYACSVVGDFNGDGLDEYIRGYNSPSGPVLYKHYPNFFDGWVRIYSGSTFWKLAALAAVDFDGDGTDELITALNSSNGPALYRGDATTIGYSKIYQGPMNLTIVAIAAGDFSGSGNEELISAFNSSSGSSLYRGQGTGVGTSFYQGSSYWKIAALTAADFDNNGSDELITGLNSVDGPAMYKGNATTIGSVKIYQGTPTTGNLMALSSGKYGSTCKMYVGFYHTTSGSKVHEHNGTTFIRELNGFDKDIVRTLASGIFNSTWD